MAQFGLLWNSKALEMDIEKVNPMAGAKRILSIEGLFEFFKALIKFVVVGAIVWFALSKLLKNSGTLWGHEPRVILGFAGKEIMVILITVVFAMFIISAFDFGFQKYRHEQKIKMTKEEVKQERKQSEGSPQIKARIRSIQRSLANRRMMDAVKKADVIVTNPTHFAVALQFDKDNMHAPRVVAKGVDFMAEKIKKIAREAGIPVVENPPLARALYKALKIGQFIQREMYNAVAEVLAYIYRMQGKDSL